MEDDNRFLYTKLVWYLVIATVTILLINIFSIAKYSSQTDSSSSLSIATPVLEVVCASNELSNLDSEPQEISFSVRNYKLNAQNERVYSDVAFNYSLKFETENGTPIECTLYKIQNGERTGVEVSSENISSGFFMPHSTETIDEFVVSVCVNDSNYSNSNDTLKIIIDGEQALN